MKWSIWIEINMTGFWWLTYHSFFTGDECPRRLVPLQSAPGNRFLCPLCNFNLCESCAESLVARKKAPSDKPPSYSILVNKGDLEMSHHEAGLPSYEDAIKMESEGSSDKKISDELGEWWNSS